MQEIRGKIILIGTVGVGKTSLIRRFVHQEFSDEYLSTIGVRVDKKSVVLDGQTIHMLIWDLAGEIINDKAYSTYLKGCKGVIGVFDVTRPTTYTELLHNLKVIKTSFPELESLIVGNKIDLVKDEGDLKMFETNFFSSALSGLNVENTFTEMAEIISKQHACIQ